MADESLEFLLKLDAQLGDAVKMVRVLQDLHAGLGHVEQQTTKVEQATVKAGHGHEKHAVHARGLTGALHRLIHSGMEPFLERAKQIAEFEFIRRGVDALLEAPGELIEKLKEIGEEVVNVTAKTEVMQKAMELGMGKEAGQEAFEWADRLAKVINFTDDELRGMALQLAKVGMGGQRLEDALRASADIAALGTDRIGGMASAVEALARLARTGVVSNRTLAAFGIGEKDFAKLDRFSGLSKKALKKQIEAGAITEAEVYKLITIHTGKALGGAAVEMGDTLDHQLRRLKNLPEQYLEKFANSPGLAAGKSKLQELLEELDPDGPHGKRIFSSLEDAVGSVGRVFMSIDFSTVATVLETHILPAIDVISKEMYSIDWVSGAKDLGETLRSVFDIVSRIAAVIGVAKNTAQAFNEFSIPSILKTAAKATLHPIETAREMAAGRGPFQATRKILNDDTSLSNILSPDRAPFKVGTQTGTGLAKGLETSTPAVKAATAAVGHGSIETMQSTLKIHSPSRVFEEMGDLAVAGYVDGLMGGRDLIRDATTDLVAPQPGNGARGGRAGAASVTIDRIEVHVDGAKHNGSPEEMGDAIAARLEEILPDHLASVLERINLQAGT